MKKLTSSDIESLKNGQKVDWDGHLGTIYVDRGSRIHQIRIYWDDVTKPSSSVVNIVNNYEAGRIPHPIYLLPQWKSKGISIKGDDNTPHGDAIEKTKSHKTISRTDLEHLASIALVMDPAGNEKEFIKQCKDLVKQFLNDL